MVYAGTTLATLEEVEPPPAAVDAVSGVEMEPPGRSEKWALLWSLVDQSGESLSPVEKDLFYHLLLSYSDVIASSTADLGRTGRLWHSIHTGDTAPIRQHPSRTAASLRRSP